MSQWSDGTKLANVEGEAPEAPEAPVDRGALALLEAAEAEITQAVFEALQHIRDDAGTYDAAELDDGEGNVGIDVRLRVQVADDGGSYCYSVLAGDPSYDTDHRGFWGSGFVRAAADDVTLTGEAREMVAGMLDHCATSS